ncbi:recombinase family protein [Longimicrobium terrae]|uniref:Recombinase domain-containing protein n=1 Tax=Longimicrobium terrae TaxID=1639882 RepID=A0A841GXD6_9BACT|nr:recombinase family protein [Longimicrobium terrae]MBB4635652.1 hypothetical protein [Longimicrobium terrae]MBB6070046.1 hypothetical protein [Longimicrobium terrae]NNC32951.1 recombinase family protein [Longimicrobium terrae]
MNHSNLAAAYGRKSTDDQQGVHDQWKICFQRAQSDGRHVPENDEFRFGDNDASGKTSNRREFERLVEVVRGGRAPFRYLYVKDKSRLGRWVDPRKHTFYECLFEEQGVKIIYCDQEEVDFSAGVRGSEGGVYLKDSADNLFAAQERLQIISRTRIGKRQAFIGGSYPTHLIPYATRRILVSRITGEVLGEIGARANRDKETTLIKLAWVEGEPLELVREIFNRISRGESLREVGKDFNQRGIPAPHGGFWSHKAVGQVVRNPIYVGDAIWAQKSGVPPVHYTKVRADSAEPILYPDFASNPPVSREDFATVQRILAGNRVNWERRHSTSPNYLASGLLVCGHCGFSYSGVAIKGPSNRPGVRLYYRHADPVSKTPGIRGDDQRCAKRQPCSDKGRYVRAAVVEERVLRALEEVLRDGVIVDNVRRAIEQRLGTGAKADQEKDRRRLNEQIMRLDRAVQRCIEDSASADMELVRVKLAEARDRFAREADELRKRLREYEAQERLYNQAMQDARLAQNRALSLRETLKSGEVRARKEAIASILERIELTLPSRGSFAEGQLTSERRAGFRLTVHAYPVWSYSSGDTHQKPSKPRNPLRVVGSDGAISSQDASALTLVGSDAYKTGQLDLLFEFGWMRAE